MSDCYRCGGANGGHSLDCRAPLTPANPDARAKRAASNLWVKLRFAGVDIDQVDIEPALVLLREALLSHGNERYREGLERAAGIADDMHHDGADIGAAIRAAKEGVGG